MMGPTGVGKTEIARRLAKLSRAPFVKVEATKFTEVGYVGRDVGINHQGFDGNRHQSNAGRGKCARKRRSQSRGRIPLA